jgi:predicted extracellular nuclease
MRFATKAAAALLLVVMMALPAAAQRNATIREIQFVHPDSLKRPGDRDNSPLLGQTVTITCVVLTGPRSLWTGARWSFIVADTSYGEWNFLQVVQNDTVSAGALATNISALQVGDVVRITGLVNEFPANTSHSQTQIEPVTAPTPVPVEFLGIFNFRLPQPILLKAEALASADLGEKYECAYIRLENGTMLNNNSGNGNGQALMRDATAQLIIDDWFNPVHALVDQAAGGSVANIPRVYPANSARFNVKGWIRDLNGPQQFALGVESKNDFQLLSNPASITNFSRTVAVPTSSQNVPVRARIADNNGTVASAKVYYSTNNGTTWQTIDMAADTGSFYQAAIPAQANGAFVRYYIWSQDNDGDISTQPGDLQTSTFFYTVRDNGPTIYDVQYTPFANGTSGYVNLSVTVSGVVTADSSDFSNEYFIQDGNAPWNGLWVRDPLNKPKRGDNITITGPVQEQFSQTWINGPTVFRINSRNNTVPAPVVVKVGDIRTGAPTAESYESMLVQVRHAVVVNPFADGASNFGEFTISDGSGEVRVDDRSNLYRGNLDTTYARGDSIRSMTGVLEYTFNNFKINPRTPAEVVRGNTTGVKDQSSVPFVYRLEQNYPNPFNPETTIRYQLAKAGQVTLIIYNMLGQKIRTLIDKNQTIGHHVQVWDGQNDRGQVVPTGIYFYRVQSGTFLEVKKMLVVR